MFDNELPFLVLPGGLMMSSSFPDVEIDADSVKATELMHRSELQVLSRFIGSMVLTCAMHPSTS